MKAIRLGVSIIPSFKIKATIISMLNNVVFVLCVLSYVIDLCQFVSTYTGEWVSLSYFCRFHVSCA